MKEELVDKLACPVCKGDLDLNIEEEIRAEGKREIVNGFLKCISCNQKYPISEKIGNLLPPGFEED